MLWTVSALKAWCYLFKTSFNSWFRLFDILPCISLAWRLQREDIIIDSTSFNWQKNRQQRVKIYIAILVRNTQFGVILSTTLWHGDCHTNTGMSGWVVKMKTCVWRISYYFPLMKTPANEDMCRLMIISRTNKINWHSETSPVSPPPQNWAEIN